MGERALARPVGLGARLAHEVIGRGDAALAGGRAHEIVLAPHRHLEGAREVENEVEDGRVPAHMVMAVEMGGEPSHDGPERVDLGAELDARLVDVGARGGLARVPDEPALRVHEGGHALGAGHGAAQGQVQVHPHPEVRSCQLLDEGGRDLAVDEERGARDDAVAMRLENAAGHAGSEPEIVGVDDEDLGLAARGRGRHRGFVRPCITRRSTLVGIFATGRVPSVSRPRMWSRRS